MMNSIPVEYALPSTLTARAFLVYFGVYFPKRKENKLNNLKSPFVPHSP